MYTVLNQKNASIEWGVFIYAVLCMSMENDSAPIRHTQPKNPLHGITLKTIVTALVDYYGWEGLEDRIQINCFSQNPSIKSSLTFLRKTPWAREEVEALYLKSLIANKIKPQ